MNYYKANTARCQGLKVLITELLTKDLVDTVLSYNNDIIDNIERIKEITAYAQSPFKLTVTLQNSLTRPILNIKYDNYENMPDTLGDALAQLKSCFNIHIGFVNADRIGLLIPSKSVLLNGRTYQEIKDAIIAVNEKMIRENMIEILCFMMGIVENLKKEGLI
jgi:hypothetical protein